MIVCNESFALKDNFCSVTKILRKDDEKTTNLQKHDECYQHHFDNKQQLKLNDSEAKSDIYEVSDASIKEMRIM